MNGDLISLRALSGSGGYKLLQGIWFEHITEIEQARDVAAKRGQESAWRYWAGQEKGFKMAMMSLDKAIKELEANESDDEPDSKYIETLLDSIKGEKK